MVLLRALALVLIVWSGLAFAQTTPTAEDDPLMGSEAEQPQQSIIAAPQTAETKSILVIGDNIAGGLGAGLSRLGETGEPVAVVNRFNEVSGLARPDFYNWPQAITRLAEGRVFHAAVVLIGVNDRREFRSGANRFAFGTPEWNQAYAGQVDAVLAALKARNIPVYWVGLPPMADPDFDEAVQQLNAVTKSRVDAAGQKFVDIRADFLNPDGTYTDRGLDEQGQSRKMRSRNGITFFKLGNTKMARLVWNAVRGTAPAVVTTTAPTQAPTATGNQTVAVPVPATGPLIGEAGADGQEIATPAQEIKVAVAQPPPEPAQHEPTGPAPIVRIFTAAPGSDADLLFTKGETPLAPAGRFDDFVVRP